MVQSSPPPASADLEINPWFQTEAMEINGIAPKMGLHRSMLFA